LNNPSVAIVGHDFPPYYQGGVGTHTQALAKYLSKRKVPTTVFCGKSKTVTEERINDYLTVVRLPLLDIPLRSYWFQIENLGLFKKRLKNFDVVHAINPPGAAVCAFAKANQQPMLTTVHEAPIFRTKAFFRTPMSDWSFHDFMSSFIEMPVNTVLNTVCFNKSRRIIAVSRSVLSELRVEFPQVPKNKFSVIHNGIDFERRKRQPVADNEEDEKPYILFYGRHSTVKGIPLLLEAMSKLKSRFPNVKLHIAGPENDSGSYLRKLTRELDLLDTVRFLGYVPNLPAQILNSLFVVLPSTYEANSMAVLEAMSYRKPVIAFNYPFSREVIDDARTGLLAKQGDPSDLASKIELLIEDENLRNRLGANAFENVHTFFDWETIVDSYVEIYREAAGYD
jgi:glycosyltransferase involved in cell wall biosynthesis